MGINTTLIDKIADSNKQIQEDSMMLVGPKINNGPQNARIKLPDKKVVVTHDSESAPLIKGISKSSINPRKEESESDEETKESSSDEESNESTRLPLNREVWIRAKVKEDDLYKDANDVKTVNTAQNTNDEINKNLIIDIPSGRKMPEKHQAFCKCTVCTHEQPCMCLHCINIPCRCPQCVSDRGVGTGGSNNVNQSIVKFEHGIQVNGHILKEVKEMVDVNKEDVSALPENVIVHLRTIDNQEMEITEIQTDGRTKFRKLAARVINTNETENERVSRSMSVCERQHFIKNWQHYWIPSVTNSDIAKKKVPNLDMNDMGKQNYNAMYTSKGNSEQAEEDIIYSSKGPDLANTPIYDGDDIDEQNNIDEPIPLLPGIAQ